MVGPNGAGKTSLLRVLAGIDRARAGTIRRTPGNPRLWGYFQSEMALPASATPVDWSRLAAALGARAASAAVHGAVWPEVDARRRAGRLSTGERKRLVLDVVLRLGGPLLLDEPYEHLSPDAKHALTRALDSRSREQVVVVATNQVTERALRDGGIHLEAGFADRLGGPRPGGEAAPPPLPAVAIPVPGPDGSGER